MGSKTKIIVLHMKEIIYTVVFLLLAILLIVLYLPEVPLYSIHPEYIPPHLL